MINYDKIIEELDGIKIKNKTESAEFVQTKSRDFYWYSPVLKRQLDDVIGDLIVYPKTEEDVIRILKTAFSHEVPVTARGAGTGNYGQAMPLSGGIVLDMSRMNQIKEITPGRMVAEPGAIMAAMDKSAQEHSGQELRFIPSTNRFATIGGFVAGGSGGVGSIQWGGLRDLGNILRLRVVTMEAEPRIIELSAWDLQKVSHAYGTNGIITEVEMPLTTAYDWVDVIVGHDTFMEAVKFCNELAHSTGILLKELCAIAAPIPHSYFSKYEPWLQDGESVTVLMVAPHALSSVLALADKLSGTVRFRSDQEDMKGIPPIYEIAWNHTTLHALKKDETITYLQIQYPVPGHLDLIQKTTEMFPDDVLGHVEFVRFDGQVQCTGLPLVLFTTEERLDEIIRLYEEAGCIVFNPHRYTLEEGGMKQTDQIQLDFKKETDPKGLLNPGKMIAWDNPDFDFTSGQSYLFPSLQNLQKS